MKFILISTFLHMFLLLGLGLFSGGGIYKDMVASSSPMQLQMLPDQVSLQKQKPSRIQSLASKTPSTSVAPVLDEEGAVKKPMGSKQQQTATNLSDNRKPGDSLEQQKVHLTYSQALNVYISQNQDYPRRARRLKQTGTVQVRFHVTPSGEFHHIHLEKACPHHLLNEAALTLIKKLRKFRPLPQAFAQGTEFIVPIQYQITRGS